MSLAPIPALDLVQSSLAQGDNVSWEVEYPLPPEFGTCVVIHGFLSPAECSEFVAASDDRGFRSAQSDYPPSYRNNDRQVVDDEVLAAWLFQRLAQVATKRGVADCMTRDQEPWCLVGLNERIRICRYRAGQRFHIHQDGVHHRGANCQSRLTFMIYLTDGDAFEGGDTLFYPADPLAKEDMNGPEVVARLRPRAGSLILFDHGIWHAGETVTRGVKHILRSDLIYRRAPSPEPLHATLPFIPAHDGYVWTIAALSDAQVASGGRDGTIRIWNCDGTLQRLLRGHQQSVLGLAELRPGLIASVSRDRTLRFWDLETGTCKRSVEAHTAAALAIARIDENMLITAGADHHLNLWTCGGDPLGSLLGHRGWVWALSRLDQNTFASASEDGAVKLWDVQRRKCVATWLGDRPLRTIDVHQAPQPESKQQVAIGDAGGWVTLWSTDGERGHVLASVRAHRAAVRRVRYLSRDLLATCGEDKLLRVWRIPDFTCIHTGGHANFVTDAIMLPTNRLLSSGYDGALSFQDLMRS